MPTVHGPKDTLQFGPFVLDPVAHALNREGSRVTVEPKVLDALHHLARHPGALVTREDLLQAVWPDVVVSDDSVSQIVRKVRAVLGDSTRKPQWIGTVHGKGYRFLGVVRARIPARTPMRRPTDAFFGREALLAELSEALERPGGVVTLLGPGGIGKTRLTLEYLDRTRDRWGPRAWFVRCVGARTAAELGSAVAQALSVPLTGDTAPAEHLVNVLAQRASGLLVLDNVEQVIDATRALLDACLERAPHLSFLVSSRIPVGLPEERRLAVGPLEPEDAERLFAARASASPRDLPAEVVGRLVDGLEGDPLSIELAAARAAVLPPERLLERLDERLNLLGRRRDEGRHGNLRNNLAWTWDLLDADDKELLEQCAGFRGGFSVEMAEGVARLPSGEWPGDVVQDLAECGLLRPDRVEGARRLHMAEALRLFCQERAEGRSDHAVLVLRRAEVLADVAERLADLHQRGDGEGRHLAGWLPDLRIALDRVLPEHPDLGARLALAAHEVLWHSGPHDEACRHLERALGAGPSLELEARLLAARLWYSTSDERTGAWLERVRALEDVVSDEVRCALLHVRSGMAERDGHREEMLEVVARALTLAESLGDRDRIAWLLSSRANTLRVLGRYEEATRAAAEALALGALSPRPLAAAIQAKALADHRGGRVQDALRGIDQLAELTERLGDRRGRLMVAAFRAIHAMEIGENEAARRGCEEALAIVRDLGDASYEARLLVNLTALQIFDGQWEAASGTARRGRALAVRGHDQQGEMVAAVNLGVARIMAGDPAEALGVLETLSEVPKNRHTGWALLWSAVACAELGQLERGEELLAGARAALAEVGDATGPPCLGLAEAIVVGCRGDRERALALGEAVEGEATHKRELLLELLHRHV